LAKAPSPSGLEVGVELKINMDDEAKRLIAATATRIEGLMSDAQAPDRFGGHAAAFRRSLMERRLGLVQSKRKVQYPPTRGGSTSRGHPSSSSRQKCPTPFSPRV
jgi:hypothetical protein